MKRTVLISLGVAVLVAAICLVGYNIWDGHRAETYSKNAAESLFSVLEARKEPELTVPATSAEPTSSSENTSEPPPAVTLPPVFTEILPDYIIEPGVEMPVVEVDGISYCALVEIPSVGICLPVSADWSMETLRFTPCRYSGSAYTNDLVIAAHNYIGHFSTLGNVGIGDPVTFTDMDGNVFRYTVSAKEVLPPTAVEEVTNGSWALTLFTCTVGGQNRVVVRCDPAR